MTHDELIAELEWCTINGAGRRERRAFESALSALRAAPGREPALPAKPTEAQLASACLSYRHDFGLLTPNQQRHVMYEAQEWFQAWRKEFPAAPPEATVKESVTVEAQPAEPVAPSMSMYATAEDYHAAVAKMRGETALGEKWKGAPPAHRKYLVTREGVGPFVATPCYGMHAPWWVCNTAAGEVEPVDIEPTDQWVPIDAAPPAAQVRAQPKGEQNG